MEFRKVTDLEKISELSDSSYILVVENDTAKQISKGDAKFGGGVTTFYTRREFRNTSSSSGTLYFDETMTQEVAAAEAWAAACAGAVRIAGVDNGMVWDFLLVIDAYIRDMSDSGEVEVVTFRTVNGFYNAIAPGVPQ